MRFESGSVDLLRTPYMAREAVGKDAEYFDSVSMSGGLLVRSSLERR